MSFHAPGAGLGRVGPYAHQAGSDYVSVNHPASLAHVDYTPSHANYVSPPSHGHANPLALAIQLDGVHPDFSAADVNARLRSQLEDSGLLDSPNASNVPPVPGTVSAIANLPHVPPVNPTRTAASLDSYEAIDEDDIAAEAILTGALPARQQPPRPRFLPIPVFSSGHRSPVPARTNPAASRRGPSIPILIFDIAPTVPLPPSPERSQASITRSREELDAYIGSSSTPNSSRFDGITRVSPRDVPATSSPSWACSGESSFGVDDSHVQAANNMSLGQYLDNVAEPWGPQYVLGYPPEEPAEEPPAWNDLSTGTPDQSLADFPFTFDHSRTGTLPPHPPGYEPWRYGTTSRSQSLVGASASLPSADGPSYSQGAHLDSFEYSTFGSDAESSTSLIEIIGNRPETSPFGPAIHPEPYQGPPAPVTTNEPSRPVRVRPFSNVFITHGAQTGTLSPLLMEGDASVDVSMPPTPSPPSSGPVASYPLVASMSAYSHRNESWSSVVITPENTLPPMGSPENPHEVTLPSIAQILGRPEEVEGLEGVDESEVSEVDESEWLTAVDEGEGFKGVNEKLGEVVHAEASGEVDKSEGSEEGLEGDDEDETDNEDEYYEYFSSGDDEFSDLDDAYHGRKPRFSRPQYSIPGGPGSKSSRLVVDDYSNTDGSAHADDGHLGYTTDDNAQ